jgi:hypothetical protein
VYVKSSLSGDEKDYILDYKKRCSKFPHESTSDQFFTEEQFEVYRALGFHAVEGFFSGKHEFSWSAAGDAPWKSQQDAMAAVRAIKRDGRRELLPMRWGLVPAMASDLFGP